MSETVVSSKEAKARSAATLIGWNDAVASLQAEWQTANETLGAELANQSSLMAAIRVQLAGFSSDRRFADLQRILGLQIAFSRRGQLSDKGTLVLLELESAARDTAESVGHARDQLKAMLTVLHDVDVADLPTGESRIIREIALATPEIARASLDLRRLRAKQIDKARLTLRDALKRRLEVAEHYFACAVSPGKALTAEWNQARRLCSRVQNSAYTTRWSDLEQAHRALDGLLRGCAQHAQDLLLPKIRQACRRGRELSTAPPQSAVAAAKSTHMPGTDSRDIKAAIGFAVSLCRSAGRTATDWMFIEEAQRASTSSGPNSSRDIGSSSAR